MEKDVIKFEPVDEFASPDNNGRIFIGPCPLDGKTDATNIRKCEGRTVEIRGQLYEITGVETFAKIPPPHLGESIGLRVRLLE